MYQDKVLSYFYILIKKLPLKVACDQYRLNVVEISDSVIPRHRPRDPGISNLSGSRGRCHGRLCRGLTTVTIERSSLIQTRTQYRQKIMMTGFTLIEIIIALFIFSILVSIVALALHQVIQTHDSLKSRAQDFNQLQSLRAFMLQDFSQIVNQEEANQNGQLMAAVSGNQNVVEFSRGGYVNPFYQAKRSSLLRVAYYLNHGQLIRAIRPIHLFVGRERLSRRVLLSGVRSIHFRYLGDDKRFYYVWPMAKAKRKSLPKAIEVSLELSHQRILRWLF